MTTVVMTVKDVNFSLPGLFEELYEELAGDLCEEVAQKINMQLDSYVDQALGREHYERSQRRNERGILECQRCGSRWRYQFLRNGHRRRGLTLLVGQVDILLPRVKCRCGGSVRLNMPAISPRQRMGPEIAAMVAHWASKAYSLRQMKAEFDAGISTSVGLRSLNDRLHALGEELPAWRNKWLQKPPPVVMLDAIWVTVMQDTDEVRKDKRGRRRVVKQRGKLPVLIALGVWPEEERHQVLDWEIGTGPGEDRDSWLRLLNRLEGRGLRPHLGLELFIHDGGTGVIAALKDLFPDVPHQRCIFHKLRNILQAISFPEDITPQERRDLSLRIIRQAQRIWQAPTLNEALKRYHRFCHQWQPTQPDAVLTLQRDFQDTVTFYLVRERHRIWPARYLRTTSLLERLNRSLRFRFRRAGAFHSVTGLNAALVQLLLPT